MLKQKAASWDETPWKGSGAVTMCLTVGENCPSSLVGLFIIGDSIIFFHPISCFRLKTVRWYPRYLGRFPHPAAERGKRSCQVPQTHFIKHWSYSRNRKRWFSQEIDSTTVICLGSFTYWHMSSARMMNQLGYSQSFSPAELLQNWVLKVPSEEVDNWHRPCWLRHFDCLLNCLAWQKLKVLHIPTFLAHCWSLVCHTASFTAIITWLF